jgi:aspartyl-tRNA synthetase
MVMIISEQNSIHEVIAFPKNTVGVSPMDDCPAPIEQKQLDELHIKVDVKDEEKK